MPLLALAACSGGSMTVDDAVMAKYQAAVEHVADVVDAANTERSERAGELQGSLDAFLADLGSAMEAGDADALLGLSSPELRARIRFSETLDAWTGTNKVSFRSSTIKPEMVDLPEVSRPPVPREGDGKEFVDSYVPMVSLRGEAFEAAALEIPAAEMHADLEVEFSVAQGGPKRLVLALDDGAWTLEDGDLLAPASQGLDRHEAVAARHLMVGEKSLEALLTAGGGLWNDESEYEFLIGTYDLEVSADWDESVLEFADITGVDLHGSLPVPTLTDEYKNMAVDHVEAVVEASMGLTSSDPKCGSQGITVNGVDEDAIFGCVWSVDHSSAEIELFESGDVDWDLSYPSLEENVTVAVEIGGVEPEPLLQIKARVEDDQQWQRHKYEWAIVDLVLRPDGGFVRLEIRNVATRTTYDI